MFKQAWTLSGFFLSTVFATAVLGLTLVFAMPFFLLAFFPIAAALFFMFASFEQEQTSDIPNRKSVAVPQKRADRDAIFHSERHQFTIRQYHLN
jgi:hypothetical protein